MDDVSTIMTRNVVTVSEDTPLQEAILLLANRDFNGLPVVDNKGSLVGLFSEKSSLSSQAYVHLRTLLKLFSEMQYYKKDRGSIQNQLKNIVRLNVKEVMNPDPAVVHADTFMDDARQLLSDPNSAGVLPVLDDNNILVGVVTTTDFAKYYGTAVDTSLKETDVDRQIDHFVSEFEKKFIIVSRFRVRAWFMVSLTFGLIGFAVAMFFILRLSLKS